MKGIKKLLTGILAATMIMGSTLSVSAADITIDRDSTYAQTNAEGEQIYTYYKILSAEIVSAGTVDHDTGVVTGGNASYYVDTQAKATALQNTGLFTATKAGQSKWIITLNSNQTTGEQIAEAVNAILKSNSNPFGAGQTKTSTGASTKIEGLEPGYYVITSSIGSTLIAQTLGENVTIKEKNTYPGVDKKQKDANTTEFTDSNVDVQVGDEIEYTLSVSVPSTATKTINVIDTMSAGLTLVTDSIKVDGFTEGTDWSVATTPAGASFQVDVEPTTATKGHTVVIAFRATVNENAIVDSGKKNEVEIVYDNYHQKDTVPFKVYKSGVHKFDGNSKEALEGVKFSIYVGSVGDKTTPLTVVKSGDYYVPSTATNASNIVVTGADGNILVRGLDDDKTYWVYEEETLPGYNMPTTEAGRSKQLTLVDDESDYATESMAQVENNNGLVLPSTGGMGTTVFYIVGAILIIAGIAYFIVRRKANAQ